MGRLRLALLFRSFYILLALVAAAVSPVCAAAPLTRPVPYRTSCGQEITYLAAGGLLNLAGAIKATNNNSPTLADINQLDVHNLPSYDRPYVDRWNPDLEKLSDVFLASSVAFPLMLILSNRDDAKTLTVVYAETILLAVGGANLSKSITERYRPFAYGDRAPLRYKLDKDARRSFFSGHTTGITSSLVFAAKVYSDYHPDSRYRTCVWGGAIIGAISGSWTRVETGWHFPSDALAGMLWGGLVGYSVPAFHHRGSGRVSLIPFVQNSERGFIIIGRF